MTAASEQAAVTSRQRAASEQAAVTSRQRDWDEDGTVSIHLPIAVAEKLLAARGFTAKMNNSWVSPSGHVYWERDEALAIALTAETL